MESLTPFIKEYGMAGAVVIGCAYIFRIIIMWLLERLEAKDNMMDTRHVELLNVTRNVMDYVNESKEINKELVQEVRNMGVEVKGLGTSICNKLDSVAGDKDKDN